MLFLRRNDGFRDLGSSGMDRSGNFMRGIGPAGVFAVLWLGGMYALGFFTLTIAAMTTTVISGTIVYQQTSPRCRKHIACALIALDTSAFALASLLAPPQAYRLLMR